jgi:hypothetical protein
MQTALRWREEGKGSRGVYEPEQIDHQSHQTGENTTRSTVHTRSYLLRIVVEEGATAVEHKPPLLPGLAHRAPLRHPATVHRWKLWRRHLLRVSPTRLTHSVCVHSLHSGTRSERERASLTSTPRSLLETPRAGGGCLFACCESDSAHSFSRGAEFFTGFLNLLSISSCPLLCG